MTSSWRRRADLVWWSVRAVVQSTISIVLFCVTVTAVPLAAVWVGIPVTIGTSKATRWHADSRRREIGRRRAGAIGSPYLRAEGNLLTHFAAIVRDPAFRRDLLWLFADATIGLALAIVAVVESLLDLLLWWLPVGLAQRARDALDANRLSVSEKSRLALRVQQLSASRAETVDAGAAEIRRIERDLHDGAQARLVSLGMTLALAEQLVAEHPEQAAALLAEARDTSSTALGELRDLVRGIHPPVLADRGLAGAVEALALAVPVPVDCVVTLDGRLSAPLESAAYFAVAEALTNVVKHADATRAVVSIERSGDTLRLTVDDDGHGGVDEAAGTGLRGIRRRLSAFDGTMQVTSPVGGPTRVVMTLPVTSPVTTA
ncbi:sensor histidine kinase [Jatrophihabitans fulvus]